MKEFKREILKLFNKNKEKYIELYNNDLSYTGIKLNTIIFEPILEDFKKKSRTLCKDHIRNNGVENHQKIEEFRSKLIDDFSVLMVNPFRSV